MPVKRRVDFLVERTILKNRQDACEAKSRFSCGTGKMRVKRRVDFLVERAGEPVHKRLINNGETSQFQLRYCTILARTGFPSLFDKK